MKERITAAELKAMTIKELAAWVEFNACAINRTMVMSWGHEELFKGYHIRPEYIGYNAGRLIVKAFHFTSRTKKADAVGFVNWLHWAIFGEYPAEETEEAEATTEAAETEAEVETIEETAEESKEVVIMKKYFKVTFEYAEGIYCANLAHAETAEDVEREYSKYTWRSVKEAQPWDVEEAKMKGMPIIEVEAAQQPQEAAQETPAAEAEQQPTETENAPHAATQAAEGTAQQADELDKLRNLRDALKTAPNPDTIRAALDAIRQHDPETELTEDDSPRAIKSELQHIINGIGLDAYMEQARAQRAPWPTDTDTDTDTDTEEEEEEETMHNTFTPAEAAMHEATARGIIRRKGGYRERDLLSRPHTIERGTWTTEHKVVEILSTTPDPDGYRPGCAVDIVTRSIVG